MKKIYKRFLAIAVAAMMTVGINVTCFAAESDESPVADSDVIEFDVGGDLISNNEITEFVIGADGTVSLVEPRSVDMHINTKQTNVSSSATWSDSFYTSRTGTLHVAIQVTGSCHINVKLKRQGSLLTTNLINTDVSDRTAQWNVNDTVPGGSYVQVTLNSFRGGTDWILLAWVEA